MNFIDTSLSKGNENDSLIISNKEQREKFIKEKKSEYSKILNVPQEKIIISHLELGLLNFWFQYVDKDINEDDLNKIKEDAKNKGENIDVQLDSWKISKDMFEVGGNRSRG